MKFCTKCGTELREGARFCPKCGTPKRDSGDTNVHADSTEFREHSDSNGFFESDYETNPQTQNEIPNEAVFNTVSSYYDGTDAGKLKGALYYFSRMRAEYEELSNLVNELSQDNAPLSGGKLLFIGIVLCAISFLILILFLDSVLVIPGFLGLLASGITAIAGIGRMLSGNQPLQEYSAKCVGMQKRAEELETLLHSYYALYTDSPVPYEYSHPSLIEALLHYIELRRADTVKEAINCMVNDIHNEEMRKLQEQAAKNAEEAAKSARSAKMYSAATFVNIYRRH